MPLIKINSYFFFVLRFFVGVGRKKELGTKKDYSPIELNIFFLNKNKGELINTFLFYFFLINLRFTKKKVLP